MVSKIASTFVKLVSVLRTYPALSAALVNVGVVVAGHFGLHITGSMLVADVAVLDVLFGAIVHSNVVPLVKTGDTPVAK